MTNRLEAALAQISKKLEAFSGLSEETLNHILLSIAFMLAALMLRTVIAYLVHQRVKDLSRRYMISKTAGYVLGFALIIALFRIWFGGTGNLLAYFGLLSAGLAIALQDPIANVVGWVFITIRKPFVVGDRIQIGAHCGDVIDVRPFQFTLLETGNWVDADQSTGRMIHIPNGLVFKQPQANYTQGFNFIWNELAVMVTFESNWKKAKGILGEIAHAQSALQSKQAENEVRRAARKYLIFFEKLTPIVWTSVADSGVVLTIRYLCEPRRRRSSATAIWEAVLTEFGRCPDIDFAYPTTRFYDNAHEGKPEARVSPESSGNQPRSN